MKRIITLLIAFLLLLALTACAEEKQDPDTTTAAGDRAEQKFDAKEHRCQHGE